MRMPSLALVPTGAGKKLRSQRTSGECKTTLLAALAEADSCSTRLGVLVSGEASTTAGRVAEAAAITAGAACGERALVGVGSLSGMDWTGMTL